MTPTRKLFFTKLNNLNFDKIVFYLFLLILPTQLSYHLWFDFSFVYGIRVDYLAITIYLSDLIILFNLILAFFNQPNIFKIDKKIYLPIVIFALTNTFLSISPYVTLYRWIKLLVFILFAFNIYKNKNKLLDKTSLNIFFISLVGISLIGIAQFVNNGTLNGIFYLLGERNFNIQTPGIALQSFGGNLFLRPYSIFPHPNALAGYIVISVLFLIINKFNFKKPVNLFGLLITILCFFLTGSLGAFIALFVSLILLKFVKNINFNILIILGVVFSFLLTRFSNLNLPIELTERVSLFDFALTVIKNNLFIGSGLNTFVVNSYRYLLLSQGIYMLQPVHNIFVLLLAEVGLVGSFLIYKLILNIKNNKKHASYVVVLGLLFIVLTGMVDHYWLTIQQNILILILFVVCSVSPSTSVKK